MILDLRRVTALAGLPGAGKTLSMAIIAKCDYENGMDLFANFGLKLPHKKIMSLNDLESVENGRLLLDEVKEIDDSRRSQSTQNMAVNYVLSQARKLKLDVAVADQTLGAIDKRIRAITERMIEPEIVLWRDNFGGIYRHDGRGKYKPHKLMWTIWTPRRGLFSEKVKWAPVEKIPIIVSDDVLACYDTHEPTYDWQATKGAEKNKKGQFEKDVEKGEALQHEVAELVRSWGLEVMEWSGKDAEHPGHFDLTLFKPNGNGAEQEIEADVVGVSGLFLNTVRKDFRKKHKDALIVYQDPIDEVFKCFWAKRADEECTTPHKGFTSASKARRIAEELQTFLVKRTEQDELAKIDVPSGI